MKFWEKNVDTTGMNHPLSQLGVLGRILDTAMQRQKVIAQNIANINTPFYQRLALAIDEDPQASLLSGDGNAVVEGNGGIPRADGNNVSIEQEMSQLTRNSLLYNTTTQVLVSRLGTYRAAVTGR